MCFVCAGIIETEEGVRLLRQVWEDGRSRGRDAAGMYTPLGTARDNSSALDFTITRGLHVGNRRAAPTPEVYRPDPATLQPFQAGNLVISHNGTIANDEALRTDAYRSPLDSAVFAEILTPRSLDTLAAFRNALTPVQGSFALVVGDTQRPDRLWVATNYKPLYYARLPGGDLVVSSEYEPLLDVLERAAIRAVPPYTVGRLSLTTALEPLWSPQGRKTVVVASGGLDSSVAAAAEAGRSQELVLLHVRYGCHAEDREWQAVQAVARAMGARAELLHTDLLRGASSLTQPGASIAGGVEGSEYAHEWVPARNLLLLSIATAWAEANGFDTLTLGANLEESGAYPDNEPEFLRLFEKVLPYATAADKQIQLSTPVGNLMKHEIVALGDTLGAPTGLTWSCYHGRDRHCGQCGPCFMRREAFRRAGVPDPLEYEA